MSSLARMHGGDDQLNLRRARPLLILMILFLWCCTNALIVPSVESQQSKNARIRVRVVDQGAVGYEGVIVQIWKGDLVDSGTTDKDGRWMSKYLPAEGSTYDVRAYNGQTVAEQVKLPYLDVFVELQLERAAPAPILVVSNVTFEPEKIVVGGEFRTRFLVTNIGPKKTVTATLSLMITPSLPFGVIGSGTVLDIGQLEPGSNNTVEAALSVDGQAKTGTYSVPYTISYTDENNYSYSDSGAFGVVVRGTPQVQLQDITADPTPLTPGADGALTIQLINLGTEVAHDVTVRIFDGDELLTNTVTYVGEIGREATKTIIFGIHVDPEADEGTRMLNITMTYADPGGDSFSYSRTYDLQIFAPQPLIPTSYLIMIAVGAVGAVGAYVAFRRLGIELW
jgi:hypothetical protein